MKMLWSGYGVWPLEGAVGIMSVTEEREERKGVRKDKGTHVRLH